MFEKSLNMNDTVIVFMPISRPFLYWSCIGNIKNYTIPEVVFHKK